MLLRYIGLRAGQAVLVLFAMSVLGFALMYLVGNPVHFILGPMASEAEIVRATEELGLDKPLHIQYLAFVSRLFQEGNLGRSYYYGVPALPLVLERVPATLSLAVPSLILAVILSLPTGVLAAANRGRALDRAILTFSILGLSTPVFWLAVVLVYVFSVRLGLLPSSGYGEIQHLVLPLVGITTTTTASLVRLVRSEMLETLGKDFIRTARAKGIAGVTVLVRHALRCSLIPFVTYLGLVAGNTLAGTVITEQIFAWPGTGRLLLTSLERLDQPVIVAFLILTAALFVCLNFVVDVAYMFLEPKLRHV